MNPLALVRALRGADRIRGWRRIADRIADGSAFDFTVDNGGLFFSGNTRSFIDRQMYLYGHYERPMIDLFLSKIPIDRHGIILDVGANVGTHAIRFARVFDRVFSFEPNAALWDQFQRNMNINGADNVTLCRFGLGVEAGRHDFYVTEKENAGLGTFSSVNQYDLPLKKIGVFSIENGDVWAHSQGLDRIDAVKIDVQGFEHEVLSGLRGMLDRFRPVIWFECATATEEKLGTRDAVEAAIPYPISLYRFTTTAAGMIRRTTLEKVESDRLHGDYLIIPAL
ncbi:FkbM family methyltransferase [Rhizorhabdus sp.]|uniref:FkbM family methyltransferase n=1 Tax=Rhizorhabdus sp. TaxID=1968843 RepID=UPI0019839459|nr:FkbM family methyltransferase [Rhizorhabdus sp.]MBD3760751.1 FkbM family methyltransferase [Rhizorhabdus sp.]